MAEGVVQATPQPAQEFSSGPSLAPNLPISNLARAKTSLQLTPQEENLYYHHLGNLHGGGAVTNPDGTISTLYSITENIGGREYTLPSVWDGKILDRDAAISRAQQSGLQNFPSYATPAEAMSRYEQMHKYFDQDLKDWYVLQGTFGEAARGDPR